MIRPKCFRAFGILAGKMALGVLEGGPQDPHSDGFSWCQGLSSPRVLGTGIWALPRLRTEVPGRQPAVSRLSQWP